VPNARSWLKLWLPVLIWMVLIFSASSDRGSFQHSSRIIAPLVHWLFPTVSDARIHDVVVFVRKCAHVTEFAALAMLVWRALGAAADPRPGSWPWPRAMRTLLIVAVYAASDEFHQLFVPSREASVVDVMIDTSGAVLALLLVWVIGRWRQRC
jgi:VanZ family protein